MYSLVVIPSSRSRWLPFRPSRQQTRIPIDPTADANRAYPSLRSPQTAFTLSPSSSTLPGLFTVQASPLACEYGPFVEGAAPEVVPQAINDGVKMWLGGVRFLDSVLTHGCRSQGQHLYCPCASTRLFSPSVFSGSRVLGEDGKPSLPRADVFTVWAIRWTEAYSPPCNLTAHQDFSEWMCRPALFCKC